MKVGVLGGGQLGRMLALAGYPLGLRFRFLDPSEDAPAGRVGELVVGEYDDPRKLERFAAGMDVVTYEFESVPVAAARAIALGVPVFPPPLALELAQDRLLEKQLFAALGIAVPPYYPVGSREELESGALAIGFPCLLKTRSFGYDGKGQVAISDPSGLDAAWKRLGGRPLLLERHVRFERELSLVAVRGRDGDVRTYPVAENRHRDGILRRSVAPAPALGTALERSIGRMGAALLERLDYVGVLALELFEVGGGVLANEIAPRVHNSGHWTIDGAVTSQFENHVRAIVGLPLGETAARGVCGMVNLVGSIPEARDVLAVPGAHLHLYDKEPKPGRKLGHVNLCAADEAARDASLARLELLCS